MVGPLLVDIYHVLEAGILRRQEVDIIGSECVGLFFSHSSWYDASLMLLELLTTFGLMAN